MLHVQHHAWAPPKTNSLVICFIFHADTVCCLLGAEIC